MSDDSDLRSILRHAEGRVALPAEAEGRIRAVMADELDRTLHPEASVASLRVVTSQPQVRRGLRSWTAVAAVVVLLTVAALLSGGGADTEQARPDPTVLVALPYLEACLEFIHSTSDDGMPWSDVLVGIDVAEPPRTDYLLGLADALDVLVASSPTVVPVSASLRSASAEARRSKPDIDRILRLLDQARKGLERGTGIPCLTDDGA